jgi:hypothetical protein
MEPAAVRKLQGWEMGVLRSKLFFLFFQRLVASLFMDSGRALLLARVPFGVL